MEQFVFSGGKHCIFRQALRGGCLGGHGPRALYAAGRDHSQYPGNAVFTLIPVGHGGDRGVRRGGHSLYHWGLASAMVGPAMAVAIGSALQAPALVLFLPGAGGLCHQYPGRGWRAVGGAGHRHRRGGMRQGGLLRDQGGYPGDPHCDGFGGDRGGLSGGASHWHCGFLGGEPYYVGHGAAALLHGNFGLGDRGDCPDRPSPAGNLRGAGADRFGRRRRGGRLLCPDGGLCGAVLPGEPVGRAGVPGTGHPMLQMGNIVQSLIWIPPTPGLGHHRPHCHMPVPPR